MSNTKNLSTITSAIEAIYLDQQETLGLHSVFVGDQERIPGTPCLCIEPSGVDRVMSETGFTTRNSIKISLIVYHGVIQDSQLNVLECLQYSEAIADELHKDANKNLSGLLIHGWVTDLKAGIAPRAKSWWYATRMTYEGTSKTPLYT